MTKKTFEKIERICKDELVDSVTGPMAPGTIPKELERVFQNRIPEEVVIVMRKQPIHIVGKPIYQTSIYMSKEDFRKYS